ncbi:hypothetical protein ABHQ57_08965 [Tenacibaculum sp. ZH5_bin.1]|nr:hypothetical protein [Tenacibaculum mesophilum]KAF9657894.1 hypothetical protein HBA12_11780 [Tenacibaculum mesophilum]
MKKIGILICYCYVLQSCIPSFGTKKLIKKSEVEINSADINGIYSNTSDSNTELTLWRTLQLNSKKYNDTTDLESDIIKLELIKPNEIEISLTRDQKKLKSIRLNGKIKDKSFSLKRYRELIPFYPIYAKDYEAKAILSKSENELILVQGISNSGAILILGAGSEWVKTYKFEQIKN